jgi:hypothetical protein
MSLKGVSMYEVTITINLFGYKVPVSVACVPDTPMKEIYRRAYRQLRAEVTKSKAIIAKEMRK